MTFENEGGEPVLTVKRGDFDDVFIMNVTLESLGFLTLVCTFFKKWACLAGIGGRGPPS